MPPFNRFPILRLPLLPFELITKFLTPFDIFLLAVSSNEVQKCLRKLSLKLKTLNLSRDKDNFHVSLFPDNGADDYRLSLISLSPKEWQSKFQNEDNILKTDGEQRNISYEYAEQRSLKIYEKTEDFVVSKKAFFWILKLLPKMFTSREAVVEFSEVPKECVLPVVATFVQKIDKLDLTNLTSKLTSDELSNLLENYSIEHFFMCDSVEEGVKYRKSLRYPQMTLWSPQWLTIDCLLNMDCVSLAATAVSLTIEDVKKFLKKWLEGGFEKLQCASIYREEISWKSVLDGFEKKPLEQTDFEKDLFLRFHRNRAWKIERNDGKKAGVIVENDGLTLIIL